MLLAIIFLTVFSLFAPIKFYDLLSLTLSDEDATRFIETNGIGPTVIFRYGVGSMHWDGLNNTSGSYPVYLYFAVFLGNFLIGLTLFIVILRVLKINVKGLIA